MCLPPLFQVTLSLRDRHSGNLCPSCTDPPALLLELPAQLSCFPSFPAVGSSIQHRDASCPTHTSTTRAQHRLPSETTSRFGVARRSFRKHKAAARRALSPRNFRAATRENSHRSVRDCRQQGGERRGKIPARSSSLSLRCVASIVQLQPQHASSNSNNALRRGLCGFIRFLPPS